MTDLSDKEKRQLTLAIGIIALQDVITSPLVDDSNVAQCEAVAEMSKEEYDRLFDEVDQDALREKLSSPFDPLTSELATDLRKRLLRGQG